MYLGKVTMSKVLLNDKDKKIKKDHPSSDAIEAKSKDSVITVPHWDMLCTKFGSEDKLLKTIGYK